MNAISEDDLRHCSDLLRERDRPVWLATLLMPQPLRDATLVLRAFHCELTAIPRIVSEPMAGEVRLQWWADIVSGNRAGESSGHPVARALLALMKHYDLPPQTFDAKIAAHIFDLYADPMGPRDMFEGYAGETRSALYQLAWLCADPDAFCGTVKRERPCRRCRDGGGCHHRLGDPVAAPTHLSAVRSACRDRFRRRCVFSGRCSDTRSRDRGVCGIRAGSSSQGARCDR